MSHSLFDNAVINKATDALFSYLEKQKEQKPSNVLWDEEEDINIVVEPKVNSVKAHTFNSIRIPLTHSFRKDSDNDICIITRTKDVPKWTEVLLTTHPVDGIKKIMSLKEFEDDYKTQESRIQLSELFDLFIIHPSIIYKVASKIVPFLRNRNKSCGVLPLAYNLLQLGDSNNPLYGTKKYKKTDIERSKKYSLKLAKMIAAYRDSTYWTNFNIKQKFIKIGHTGMNKNQIKDNLLSIINYGLCIIPNGGLNNVMRLSLHINHSNIQLPFYVNLDPLDDHYTIVNEKNLNKHKNVNIFLKKRNENKLKKAMKKNCPKKLKNSLIYTIPITNLTQLKFVKQCNSDN